MNTNLPIDLAGLIPARPAVPGRARSTRPAHHSFHLRRMLLRLLACAGALLLALSATVYGYALFSGGAAGLLGHVFSASLPGVLDAVLAPAAEPPAPDTQTPAEPIEPVPSDAPDLYAFDAQAVPDGQNPIVPTDLSTVFATATPYLSNATDYSPDLAALFSAAYPLPPAATLSPAGEPLVLILHTHGTEAYSEEGSISYSDTYNQPRSSDTEQNVVAVGTVMTDTLNARGVPTLHCTVMHDAASYRDSYARAAETIKSYLADHPSIRYVFDVHRDSIVRENGEKLRPVFLREGEAVAQVMSVVGSDELGADFPDWEKNLTLALKLHNALEKKYGPMSRPINLRGAAFNEQYGEASMLLEVGSCGNTLSEAKRAGALLADTLADLILAGNPES